MRAAFEKPRWTTTPEGEGSFGGPAGKTEGNPSTGKVNALSSIPFEEADEFDQRSHTVARVALSMGAGLLAMWICPLIMALSAMGTLRSDARSDAIPETGPMDQATAFPSVQAA